MAFNNLPQIDINSKNSDLSETAFRKYFSQHNNFISRTDVPDKGCDFDVELITTKIQSSNWRFPVQLKSVQSPERIKNDSFISYPFETSRLNYLMQRPVSMGLLVLYAIDENKMYFEYADRLYEQLTEERDNDDWKSNDKVNVRISTDNVIDDEAAKKIHEVFLLRFQQAQKMQASHGQKYGLPSTDLDGEFKYDYNNIEHVKKFISEYGTLLLNGYDLSILYNMLSKLSLDDISSSKEILLLASIVYCEAGKYTEALMFQGKLRKRFTLTGSEQASLNFCNLKTRLQLGHIDEAEFLAELKTLQLEEGDLANQITIRINVLRYKLFSVKTFTGELQSYEAELKDIFTQINSLDDGDKRKNLFTIWNAENYSIILNRRLSEGFAEYHISQDLGSEWSLEKKGQHISSFFQDELGLLNIFNDLFKKGIVSGDKLLQANALSSYVTYYIQKQITLISYSQGMKREQGEEEHLKKIVQYALNAYNLFLELNLLKEAHYCLCNTLELFELAVHYYGSDVQNDKMKLEETKGQMERELDFEPYALLIPGLISTSVKPADSNEDTGRDFSAFSKLSDEQIESLGKITLQAKKLPMERLVNVTDELKSYRLFHQRCKDQNILVFQVSDHPISDHELYRVPIIYVLRKKDSGIESLRSTNIGELLDAWGL